MHLDAASRSTCQQGWPSTNIWMPNTNNALLKLGCIIWETKEFEPQKRPDWQKCNEATNPPLFGLWQMKKGLNYLNLKWYVLPFNSTIPACSGQLVCDNAGHSLVLARMAHHTYLQVRRNVLKGSSQYARAGCARDKSPSLEGLTYGLVWRPLSNRFLQLAAKLEYLQFCWPCREVGVCLRETDPQVSNVSRDG